MEMGGLLLAKEGRFLFFFFFWFVFLVELRYTIPCLVLS